MKKAAKKIEEVLLDMQALEHEATAAAASASMTASASMPIGTRVKLCGLTAKPELNEQWGIVVGFKARSGSERVKVELEDGRGPFSLKAENLHVAALKGK